MKVTHVTVALAVALVAACSSEESASESASKQGVEEMQVDDDKQPQRVYRKTEGSGDIEVVAFEKDGKYQMQLANAGRLDEGTYTFDATNEHVTFRSVTGQERTMAFGEPANGVKPKTLVQPGSNLTTPSQGQALIGGSNYELLQQASYFCKQNPSPNAANCGAQGHCPAGFTMCIRV